MASIGDRMKGYERPYAHQLTPNSPVVIRVDGKAFHSYTRPFPRPFSDAIRLAMVDAMSRTAEQMQGFRCAYTQSDEASFLIDDLASHEAEGWFGYDLSKLVSVTASMFTAYFNRWISKAHDPHDRPTTEALALFDARAFVVPDADVPNYFVWRQRDWERNSLQMLARSHFSQKALHGKGRADMHEMLHQVGVNWADLDPWWRNGTWVDADGAETHDKRDYDDIRAELARDGEDT